MKTTNVTVIDAPARNVFLCLEDSERLKQWLPNLIEDVPLTDTPDKIGSRFKQVYLERGKEMELIGEVTEYVDNERMRVDITANGFGLDIDYHLKSLGPAQTELTQDTQMKFFGFMKVMAPLFVLVSKFSSKDPTAEAHALLKEMCEAEYQAGKSG